MESVAAAALPMPSARCPAARPMLMMIYQREVVRASSIRLRTMLHAVMPRGLETERRRRAGQRQVVVNRLGHVRHVDFSVAALGHLAGGKGRVIAANRHQRRDAELVQKP